MAESKWEFKDNTIKVLAAMGDEMQAVLEECTGELESQVKRNSRVDTGKTKNSFQHKVTKDGDEHIGVVGSSDENAIWEEFGTGEHALEGNGRKGGWAYKDAEGHWHYTTGKNPSRAFWKAYTSTKNAIIKRIQSRMSRKFKGK